MELETTIDTYLKEISISGSLKLKHEIFTFLQSDIRSENADGNEEKIAKLFCRTVESFNQDESLSNETESLLLKAFNNIKGIENISHNNGELMCVYLLNILSAGQSTFDEFTEDDFSLLLDNLEKIRIVFKICDENNNLYFPIGKFLFKLINSENLLDELNKVSSIQALMLALQIFDRTQFSTEIENIERMIQGKNLKFIEYILHNSRRIGLDDWKENYEKNGLLILLDTDNNKVLIRNHNESYFSNSFPGYKYGMDKPGFEKNSKGNPIAYYVEYQLDEFIPVNIHAELQKERNSDRISQLLDIIYCYKNYNIAYDSSLFEVDGKIYPINPFEANDKYFVSDGNAAKDCKAKITTFLLEFGLLHLAGMGLEYINLGAIVAMDEIYAIPFSDYKISNYSSLDSVLSNWLEKCFDKQKCFIDFFDAYYSQIEYITNLNELFVKVYDNEYIVPHSISTDILEKIQFDEKFQLLYIEKCIFEINKIQNKIKIKKSSGETLEDYSIEDISGEELNIQEGEFYALIDDEQKIIYVGKQVNLYHSLKTKISLINESLPPKEVFDCVKEGDVLDVMKYMNCFKKAFQDIHKEIPLCSISRYRLINHLTLISLEKEDVRPWLNLLKKHDIVDYSVAKGNSPIVSEQGVLYVPKDRGRAQSTMKNIYNDYFSNNIRRTTVDIFDPKITKVDSIYYTGDKMIEKVVILFDLIQSGSSTNKTIDYYMTGKVDEFGNRMTFVCDGSEISAYEIIQKNHCNIEIYSIYASEKGINNVRKYVSDTYPSYSINILNPLRYISATVDERDMEIIHRCYPENLAGKIHEGNYLVVREYNQPKRNVMNDNLLDVDKVISIFCKKDELGYIRND